MNKPFVLPTHKTSIAKHFNDLGMNVKAGFDQLARTGSIRLSADVKVTYCNRRYHLVDEDSAGGENVAHFAKPQQREMIPAARADADGTWEQRRTLAEREMSELKRQERFRQMFLELECLDQKETAPVKSLHNSIGSSRSDLVMCGDSAILPAPFPAVDGILLRRTVTAFTEVWDGAAWKRFNKAGFAIRFGEAMPDIPVGNWALVHSQRLAQKAATFYIRADEQTLIWALHVAEPVQKSPRIKRSKNTTGEPALGCH